MRKFALLFVTLGLLFAAPQAQGEKIVTLAIASPAFANRGEIPVRYTGEGENISPPLIFLGVPSTAKSLALIVDDPDAPDPAAPTRVFVHWVVFNIPPTAPGLDQNVKNLPAGAREGLNDHQKMGYTGPMPPIGRHRYFFKLYALDSMLDIKTAPTKTAIESAMQGHIVTQAELVGTYEAIKK